MLNISQSYEEITYCKKHAILIWVVTKSHKDITSCKTGNYDESK